MQTLPQIRTLKMPLLGVRAIESRTVVCCAGVFPVYSPVRGVVSPVQAGYPLLAVNVLPMNVTDREHFLVVQVGQARAMGWPRE